MFKPECARISSSISARDTTCNKSLGSKEDGGEAARHGAVVRLRIPATVSMESSRTKQATLLPLSERIGTASDYARA